MLKIFLISFLFISTVCAGGWTQKAGGGYAKTWVRWQAADGFLNGHHNSLSDIRNIDDYNEIFLNAYGEYGLTDRLTLLAHWPLITGFLMSGINRYSYIGTGDITLGLKYGLVRQQWVLALQLATTAPLAESTVRRPFKDADTGETIGALRVGAGVWDVEPRLQTGIAFNNGHLGAEVGYRLRSNGFHPVLSWMVEAGQRFSETLYGTLRMVDVRPVGTTTAPLDNSTSGIGNGTSYTGFSMELDWKQNRSFSVGFVLEGAVRYSRQAGGPVFNVYSAWQW